MTELSTSACHHSPLVSVIMNCYNGQKYLREAIDSVLAQTYENFEIIFWDNQSTDESASIFKSYSDSRLKYFYAPTHTFLYEARNYAVKKAEGEFFAFLDVDDTWAPRKLEQQIPLFTADSEVGFVCSNYWIVQQETGVKKIFRKKKLPRGRVLNDLLLDYPVGLLTLVLRRTAFESLKRGCDPRFHVIGDMDLTVRLAMSWKMDSVQEPLAFYRLHGNNEGQKQKERQVNEFKVFVDELQKNPDVASLSGYQKISQELIYMQGRLYLLRDEKEKIRICLNQLKWGRYKIKLWILFVFKFWRLGR